MEWGASSVKTQKSPPRLSILRHFYSIACDVVLKALCLVPFDWRHSTSIKEMRFGFQNSMRFDGIGYEEKRFFLLWSVRVRPRTSGLPPDVGRGLLLSENYDFRTDWELCPKAMIKNAFFVGLTKRRIPNPDSRRHLSTTSTGLCSSLTGIRRWDWPYRN